MRSIKYIVIILVLSFGAQAQDDVPEAINVKLPLVSLRLNAGIPNPSANEVFRRKFIGIYETGVAVNFRIAKLFFVGVGFKNGLISVSNRVRYDVNTKMEMNTAFVKVGYNHFHTNKIFSSFYFNAGYNKSKFTGVKCLQGDAPDPHWSSYVFEPGYSINFFAEDHMTLGFYATYNYMPKRFDPDQVCFSQVTSLSGLSTKRNTSYFVIGLEMYWGLAKKKR